MNTPTPETDAAWDKYTRPPYTYGAGDLRILAQKLEREREMLRTALEEIYNLCQVTCLSFEEQSFEATKIASSALAQLKEEVK